MFGLTYPGTLLPGAIPVCPASLPKLTDMFTFLLNISLFLPNVFPISILILLAPFPLPLATPISLQSLIALPVGQRLFLFPLPLLLIVLLPSFIPGSHNLACLLSSLLTAAHSSHLCSGSTSVIFSTSLISPPLPTILNPTVLLSAFTTASRPPSVPGRPLLTGFTTFPGSLSVSVPLLPQIPTFPLLRQSMELISHFLLNFFLLPCPLSPPLPFFSLFLLSVLLPLPLIIIFLIVSPATPSILRAPFWGSMAIVVNMPGPLPRHVTGHTVPAALALPDGIVIFERLPSCHSRAARVATGHLVTASLGFRGSPLESPGAPFASSFWLVLLGARTSARSPRRLS